ncbi:Rhodanese-related sulfurtransferase [Thioflavicoccus mobilis 8321]|uniref:Rhodanese-related sulfurtransferase n=1 Tax=Thioflavicoccus mobilis 8321 TaxID=765912 RepID=L0GVB2_9GAMM|nr:rhodanese-like domain-containing protein [Thioflavicoccus mobilis]AGA90693.1 Rhodanese-related sulfurtransferase [Thioflavicoccus mobilis 8321]
MKKRVFFYFASAMLLTASLLLASCGGTASSGPELSAPEALEMAERGELTIVDVRTPGEWRRTGVGAGALEINMIQSRGPDEFVEKLLEKTDGDKDAPLALICRTGNRSGHMQRVLMERGFTHVYNISEGMAGSDAGPGWLERGLPVEDCSSC